MDVAKRLLIFLARRLVVAVAAFTIVVIMQGVEGVSAQPARFNGPIAGQAQADDPGRPAP